MLLTYFGYKLLSHSNASGSSIKVKENDDSEVHEDNEEDVSSEQEAIQTNNNDYTMV